MKPSNTATRLKEIMDKRGLRQVDLLNLCTPYCTKYGVRVKKNELSQYLSGKVEPRQNKLTVLSEALKVSAAWLLGYNVPMYESFKQEFSEPLVPEFLDNIYPIDKQSIPFLGEIACGKPIYANEERESYVQVGTEIHADFCLRAKGDSMIGARINDGDIVFIKKQEMVNNGEIAAVIIEDEATLKRVYYYPEKSKLVLQAENSKYEPLVYVGEELNEIRILGKAIAFQSDVT